MVTDFPLCALSVLLSSDDFRNRFRGSSNTIVRVSSITHSVSLSHALNSCHDGAAACDDAAAGVSLVPLCLWPFLCTSSTNAALDTSLLRSILSARCGVTLSHSLNRTLQHVCWPRSSSTFLLFDSCPLIWCSCKRYCRDGNWINTNFWPVHCPPAVCQSHRHTVPSGLRFQSSDFTSSEHTVCITHEAFCTVASHSEPYFENCTWD